MKSLSVLWWFRMPALLLSLLTIPVGTLAQQNPQPQTQAPAEQTPPPNAQTQTFTGKLMRSKGSVVLQIENRNTAYYGVDNGAHAKAYVGKNVRITGTLDPATNMIHVSQIELVAGF